MENNTSLQQQLLEAGVHFGHLRKKWNPKMLPYIYAEKKGIHIIDLNKTVECLQETASALKSIAKSGKKIMFVGTKKQAKEIVTECAQRVNMPYVTERWLGGMLTNFNTVRKSVKKMQSIEKMLTDGTFGNITKKERLQLARDRDKMDKVLGGIANWVAYPLPSSSWTSDMSTSPWPKPASWASPPSAWWTPTAIPTRWTIPFLRTMTPPSRSPSSPTTSPLPSLKVWLKGRLRKPMKARKANPIIAWTASVRASSVAGRLSPKAAIAAPNSESISTHRTIEPSWFPQTPEIR